MKICKWTLSAGMLMLIQLTSSLLVLSVSLSTPAGAATVVTADKDALADFRPHIVKMKSARRGPFKGIRWFCNDGTIHPPKPYPCRDRKGGIQHALIGDVAADLRKKNILIANILAEVDVDALAEFGSDDDILASLLLERFLVGFDDGWIFRQARYYRGAFQIEDEEAAGRVILNRLLSEPRWVDKRFAMILTAASQLPHGTETPLVSRIRGLAATINNQDNRFKKLRSKIHGNPDQKDADRVREFAAAYANSKTKGNLDELARLIDQLESTANAAQLIGEIAASTGASPVTDTLNQTISGWSPARNDPLDNYRKIARSMSAIRQNFDQIDPRNRLSVVDNLIKLNEIGFVLLQQHLTSIRTLARDEILHLLRDITHCLYGVGLLSVPEFNQTDKQLRQISSTLSLKQYRRLLGHLERVPVFAQQRLQLFYSPVVSRWQLLEPLTEQFIPDLLRSSHLLAFSNILEILAQDIATLGNIQHQLFKQSTNVGLTRVNPGLARGILLDNENLKDAGHDSSRSIVVVPQTLAEIEPVAGILTAFEGNQLSHVQLLARNLGVPNVVVSASVLAQLKTHHGTDIVLAASPHGVVVIDRYGEDYRNLFNADSNPQAITIKPDLNKLDLDYRQLIPTSVLRAKDSGKRVGPKAAQVGELAHHYPAAVSAGLAIPFGIFKALLDNPFKQTGLSGFDWLKRQYQTLDSMKSEVTAYNDRKSKVLAEFRRWIIESPLDPAFEKQLKQALSAHFGPDGDYGVFVRSDTNVEDLEGFTGAGLNLTVANVVGVNNIISAIKRVWASPFSERAFGWRQALMKQPEHVYAAVLLHQSVNSDKSGVLVSKDIIHNQADRFTVVVNEGVAGGVDGLSAETLVINRKTGEYELVASATAPYKRIVNPKGGVGRIRSSDAASVLSNDDINALIDFTDELPRWFGKQLDEKLVADVEFGFKDGKLILFQIRPFVENQSAQNNQFLNKLDENLKKAASKKIDLTKRVTAS